jgi:hypothetical protein
LNEFCVKPRYNRKYAIRLQHGRRRKNDGHARNEDVAELKPRSSALFTALSEGAGYPWVLQPKALLPSWMLWIRKHYRARPEIERQLLRISARQMARRIHCRTKPSHLPKHHIPVKTDRWDVAAPGSRKWIWYRIQGIRPRGSCIP